MKEIYLNNNNKDICDYISKNYGRSICPYESNKIDEWSKYHSMETIKKAVDILIENSVQKFSYISAILNNWRKETIIKSSHKKTISKEDIEILNYDWLNDPENWFDWQKKD